MRTDDLPPPEPGRAPVAIVGTGLRLPGGVRDLAGYWRLLVDGIDTVSRIPADRWDADRLWDPTGDTPGTMVTRQGAFLDDVASFDPAFFGIAPREALQMDPAQRLLLEIAWEALEDAAIAPDRLRGSATGVYVGLGLSDYARRHFLGTDRTRLDPYTGTGAFLSVAAGRIAYTLGLSGPAMTVDTACSSSLVSVHLAVEALRRGEVDLALAGGANVILAPEPSIYFSALGALAPDGRCKAFSAAADGYGRGEGAGVVVLRRLDDARSRGERILAVIRGTAVNHDGRSNGLTAPSGRAQQAVIRRALHDAGADPEQLGLVEAHGTGTPLGDPVEFGALGAVFSDPERPIFLGSVKTNVGHLETAAGIAGLIKAALCIQHCAVPPHLHLDAIHPRIRLDGTGWILPTATTPWDEADPMAGVSAFGLSGTNAHVILGAPPTDPVPAAARRAVEWIPLSAHGPEQLVASARRWADALADAPLADAAHTAQVGRAQLPHRLSVCGATAAEIGDRLRDWADGGTPPSTTAAEIRRGSDDGVVFLFTGQGAQFPGMGRPQYDADPVFRRALDRAMAAVDPHLDQPLADVMWGEGDALHDTRFAQPALFALEIALADWWGQHGIEAEAVMGHSVGEIVAAVVAGALDLQDAAALVVARGRLMGDLPAGGGMCAVFAGASDVRGILAASEIPLDIAGINGPTETVVSGAIEAIDALVAALAPRGIQQRRLVVSHAFHSAAMDPILDAFREVADAIAARPPTLPLMRNIDGRFADGALDADHWIRHLRGSVCFSAGLETLIAEGHRLFLEIGPRPALSGMGRRLPAATAARFVPSMDDADEAPSSLTAALGALWAHGAPVPAVHTEGQRLALPTTPFRRDRYWLPAPDHAADPSPILEVVWRGSPAPEPDASPGSWIVVGSDALADAMRRRGATVHDEDAPPTASVIYAPVAGDGASIAWAAARALRAEATGRLWLVGDLHDRPETAVLQGIGRAIRLEDPDRWGGFVDRHGGDDDAVAAAILAGDGEDWVQVTVAGRAVARLVQRDLPAPADRVPPGDDAVWITGGLGALGSHIAHALVDRGARHLVLSGRRGADAPEAATRVAALRARGVTVTAARADVTTAADVRRILDDLGTRRLAGIVHAAGIRDDGWVRDQTEARFAAVMAPKIAGTLQLHEATSDRDLDFFVLVGSAAGILGTPGQGAYAAGSAFLDAFARWRRARGLPATAVAFGPWGGAGMAAEAGPEVRAQWSAAGIRPLAVDEGVIHLGHALGGGPPARLIAPFDWPRFGAHRGGDVPLLREIVPVSPDVEATPALSRALAEAPVGARATMLMDHLQRSVSDVLGLGPDRRVGITDGFFDAGMDSVMATELSLALQRDLGRSLPPTLAFDFPTVERLTQHLLQASSPPAASAEGAPTSQASHGPIAIVGASCRLPGAVGLDALWALIASGADAMSVVPADRYDADAYYDPEAGTPGRSVTRSGGFLVDLDAFDPKHYSIAPREAQSLDPQQRLLLDAGWHALEDAAIPPRSLVDTPTGVYVGIGPSEYGIRFDPRAVDADPYAGIGNESSFAAGRLAYTLGLQGPAMSVNTACSSSLVSVHLAVTALRLGQCDLALAGGANVIAGPDFTLWISMLRALAPDGRCKPFAAEADGYARSEGCGMVVLKRLSDAERDGDRILAVIHGSAVGHDGASAGPTVPNGHAQQQVIRAALSDAGIAPGDVGFVQTHGTGTPLGDPIEVGALAAVLGDNPAPVHLGAVKGNLGHLEAAAGIAGLLATVATLQHATIPPIAHLSRPNPALPLDGSAIRLPTEIHPWTDGAPRLAGVSAFGISGTNAHVILGSAPPAPTEAPPAPHRPIAVGISGRTRAGRMAQADAIVAHLATHDVALPDLAFTLNTGRSGAAHRAVAMVAPGDDVGAALAAPPLSDVALPRPRIVFLCTGAGPQQAGMGQALYTADATFRAALDDAAAVADDVLEIPLLEVLYPTDGGSRPELHDLSVTQPAMFALQWAMAALWRRLGITPDAVMGHSTGQYLAACLAGVFDLETGLRLMARRGRLMSTIDPDGAMVALFTTLDDAQGFLSDQDDVSVAAVNGPTEIVISGRTRGIEAAVAEAEAAGIEIRRLQISHAAHSPLVDAILDAHDGLFDGITLRAPQIPLITNLTGAFADPTLLDVAHWRAHLRQPVQFLAGMRTLVDAGYDTFVELGNHPVLCGAGARCVEDASEVRFVPSLRRGQPDWTTLTEAIGRLWSRGAPIDWAGVHADLPGNKVSLPGTVFQTERCWVDPPEATRSVVGRNWTHGVRWRPLRLGLKGIRSDAHVVIFADDGGLGERIAARRKEPCVLVTRGSTYDARGPHITVDPTDPDHLDRLLSPEALGGATHVIDLWPLDPGPPEVHARSALHLIQAAARHGGPAVWLVTRGAAGPGGERDLDRAPLLGLATSAAVELDLPVLRIDLDPADPDGDLTHLDLMFESGLQEDQVAVRDGQVLARRLEPIPATGGTPPPIRSDATYLVTGGLGALGSRVADWLAEAGAGAIVLVSRSVPAGEAAASLAARADAHPETAVVHRQADVGAPGAVNALLASLDGLPEVVGVFHAAGVLDDAAIPTLTWERFPAVWHPKVSGARALDEALPDAEIFVCFSSAASIVGSPGQANYASANAWCDALAHHRRARGVHGVSIGFGPVSGAGLATASLDRGGPAGVRPIRPAQAVAVLWQLLSSPDAEIAVIDIDWPAWGAGIPRVPQLVAHLAPPPSEAHGHPLRAIVAGAPTDRRRGILVDAVAGHAGAILGIPVDELDLDRGFSDLGMDSLMAVDLANRLKADLDPALSVTLAFDHPTIGALADHLLGRITAPAPTTVGQAPRRIDPDEPIAIVGMSCRMPGGANDPEAFWDLLVSGRDPQIEIPPDRWDLAAVYDPVPGTPGKMYTRYAGFVDFDCVEGFEPSFFGISPREANSLDPQQRMLLEVSTEALERAGILWGAPSGSPTGVFVGAGDSGYLQRFHDGQTPLYRDAYAGTGSLSAFFSGRIAHALGLRGPNLAVNTACSSSLVAVHLAAAALRAGECRTALAGGVHLMLSPDNFVYVSQLEALSPHGRCKTFDAAADGYGRAEGCAMFVLERLSDAIDRGDPILAVIRGTAIGHDGASSGLTVPNGSAQIEVLSAALDRSGLEPAEISYLEAHGTGTSLGDPIEVGAAAAVYGVGRSPDCPLHLGAVKSNIGHLEVAAGAASLLKVVLALQHRTIPPHLHLQTPNPALDLDTTPMVIDTAPTPWDVPAPRRAGISAFGLAGTNAHLVVEEAPPVERLPPVARGVHLLPISARSDAALRDLASALGDRLGPDADWPDLARTAATTRRPREVRLAIVAPDAGQARDALTSWLAHGRAPGVVGGTAGLRPPRIAFLFSGQGSQHPGMGHGLYEAFAVYRDTIDRCARATPDLDLIDALHAPTEDRRIHQTATTQPCLFAHEVALAALWRSVGVVPEWVAGHSVGQIAAAQVAGVVSLEDGMRLVVERGRRMGSLPPGGVMMAVFADERTVNGHLATAPGGVGIAGVNHPEEVVVSGLRDEVEAFADALRSADIECRPLEVSHAFHSALMDPILDDFGAFVAGLDLHPPTLPVMCNATGGVARPEDLVRPDYWRDLIRRPVRFADNLIALADAGADLFVEVGPHTTLLGMARRTIDDPQRGWIPSLRRGEPDPRQWLSGVGAAFCRGVAVDWSGIHPHRGRQDLPTTPWQRKRCWIDAPEWPGRTAAPAADLDAGFVAEDWIADPIPSAEATGIWGVIGTSDPATALILALRGMGVTVHTGHTSIEALATGVDVDHLVVVADPRGEDAADAVVHLLELAQAEMGSAVPATLALVTTGAVAAAGDPVTDPAQGALWGLMRVIRLEAARLAPLSLDLDPAGTPTAWIAALLDRTEPEQALRGSTRYVRRLTAVAVPPGPQTLAGRGPILITGGVRGLGLEVAAWLAAQGAPHLILVSRSGPTAADDARIGDLRSHDTQITVARGDVSSRSDVDRILAQIPEDTPLDGIIHAAGVLADASLLRLQPDDVRTVFAPKVSGAQHLYAATVGQPLSFFVLFSGGAGLLGSPGQGNYAAANAYLDAFAHWARGQGVPAVSIAWGAWADVGMAARLGSDHAARQADEGIRPLSLEAGLTALGRLLDSPRPHVGVMNIDWPRLVDTFYRGACPPLLQGMIQAPPPVPSESAPAAPPSLPDRLAAQPRDAWPGIVADRIAQIAVSILGLDPAQPLDRGQPLLELGLDSLMAVELKNALMDAGVDVPVAPVMTGPSIDRLTALTIGALPAPAQVGVAPGPAPGRTISTHALAFVLGIVFAVGSYMITAAVVGPRQDAHSPDPPSVPAQRSKAKGRR